MRRQAGFTLIEILVAVALLALVLSTVYGVYAAAETGRRLTEEKSAALHLGRVVFDRLERELVSLVPATGQDNPPNLVGTRDGEGYRLELLTLASAGPADGVHQVIWQDRVQDGSHELVRSDRPWPVDETASEPEVLDERITGFSARFYSRSDWKDQWDSRRDGLPQLIELNLRVQVSETPVSLRTAVRLPTEERF